MIGRAPIVVRGARCAAGDLKSTRYLTKVREWTRASCNSVRRFNRLVTQRVGALEVDYLRRGRPLAEARLIFEISADGVDVLTLRSKLGLDSGYLSRLLQSLKTQGLIAMAKGEEDGRRRRVSLTRKGSAERAAYDRLSDNLAASMLGPLDASEQKPLAGGDGRS